MRFNLETIKEYLTQNENEWCGEDDWWGDADTCHDSIMSINVYSIKEYIDTEAHPDEYGVTIYELRCDDDGNWGEEIDEAIVGQLYFKHITHIPTNAGGKLFQITDVIDYEHYVYNNMDAKNPTTKKESYEDTQTA